MIWKWPSTATRENFINDGNVFEVYDTNVVKILLTGTFLFCNIY